MGMPAWWCGKGWLLGDDTMCDVLTCFYHSTLENAPRSSTAVTNDDKLKSPNPSKKNRNPHAPQPPSPKCGQANPRTQ